MLELADLPTPAALIDLQKVRNNIQAMQAHAQALGVQLRPHVKTSKCLEVARMQRAAGASGVTVSTLKEAEALFADGERDILYAVGISPDKLPRALALRRQGCALKIITDSLAAAEAIASYGQTQGEAFEVWIEIDSDGHRAGVAAASPELLAIAEALKKGGQVLGGVMTHAGASYALSTPDALAAMAERERAGAVAAAERLRAMGHACRHVSVGSTPTALSARALPGVTELRAGVYVFFDLVMYNTGVCSLEQIALSVLTTVIGHQPDKGWAIVDAGWMAMSRDRGTDTQRVPCAYGLVCRDDGALLTGYRLDSVNQEHGIVARVHERDCDIASTLPLGTRLRILPVHACATGAQHAAYLTLDGSSPPVAWTRLHGW